MLGIYCRTSKDAEYEKSTINQQVNLGIKFCEEKGITEYEIYKDEGISGFKISDDDKDPFNNRPDFTRLINDIKNKKINSVWVWEHSRLSRNQYASAFIFNIFEKHNITIYENKKKLDLNDPTLKLTRQMLDAIAEYERQLIIGRTKRGLHKSIDEGKKSHPNLYGYKKSGKDDTGHTVWTPVESQIENYKYILKRFMEGTGLKKICYEINDMNKVEKNKMINQTSKISRLLKGYQYTGYQLTMEGLSIYRQFRNNEIENIQILLNKKYWVKSKPYPLELISVKDWVKINEKLQIYSKKHTDAMKERTLRATSAIVSGILKCGNCGNRYYYRIQKTEVRKDGTLYSYPSYYHMSVYSKNYCGQKPKTIRSTDIDEIIKIFYFFSYMVFDDTNELQKESLRNIKQTLLKLKETVDNYEKETARIERLLLKYNRSLETTDDNDVIYVLSKNIKTNEDKLSELNVELSKMKIEYEKQNEKYGKTEREMTYYDVKERVLNWFKKLSVEDQRNELIKIVKTCNIYGHYILIDTGMVAFFFDINQHYVFDKKLLKMLDGDEIHKLYFVKLRNKKQVKMFNGKKIPDIDLRDEEIKLTLFKYLKRNFDVLYDLKETRNFVSFVSLKGLYSKDD
jgi:DNA invertase Pin-like site-specific DNA recombinase/ribosomal protein L33